MVFHPGDPVNTAMRSKDRWVGDERWGLGEGRLCYALHKLTWLTTDARRNKIPSPPAPRPAFPLEINGRQSRGDI